MQNKYNTFWLRSFAALIDALLFFPFIFPELFWDMTKVRTIISLDIANLVLYTSYLVLGHGLYGQTIGKKLMGVKLLDVSEKSSIGLFRAFLRESVWVVFSVISIIIFTINTKGTEFITAGEMAKTSFFFWVSFGWLFLEMITMLTNSKRRAIHDYIAKSVVVNVNK